MSSSILSTSVTLKPIHRSTTFDVTRSASELPLVSQLRTIIEQSGDRTSSVIWAYAKLALGAGHLSFDDFVKLRLFDQAQYEATDLATFVGERRNRDLCVAINYRHDWLGLMANKVASSSYLAAYGLPTIPILALYALEAKSSKSQVLCNPDDLRTFLLRAENYPLFGKPAESFQSLGSIGLAGVAPNQRDLIRLDGATVDLDRLVADIHSHYGAGYVFQPLMAPNPEIAALCGNRLATVRVITALTEDGPQVFRTCWKIPAGINTADNYWRTGNLLAQIDRSSGRVGHVTSGSGLSTSQHIVHPDTGSPLGGYWHPHWNAMMALAIEGARLMRHVPLIGWDLACTTEGPLVVEMNEMPDMFLVQFADRKGVLDADFAAFAAFQKDKAAAHSRGVKASIAKL